MVSKHPLLVVVRGRLKGRQYTLERLPLLIGRGDDCDIRLPSGASSRHHARVEEAPDGKVLLRDLESRNGTQVNGQRIVTRVLVDGDQIHIGRTLLSFLVPTEAPEASKQTEIQEPSRAPYNLFDADALAQRLSAWSAQWGACAVEFRFRHGSDSHACWVANEAGRQVLEEFFQRFDQVSHDLNVNPSVTEALVKLAATGELQESEAYGWINGAATPDAHPTETQALLEWRDVAQQPGWWTSTAARRTGLKEAVPLDEARTHHARILGPGRSYLYVAIPEKAIRVSGRIDDIVLLHAIWAQEGTLVYEEAAQSRTKDEFQRRVRDAATHFLIWTSVEFLNRESRALGHWQRAWAEADLLFNDGNPRLHETHMWTAEDLRTHHPSLQAIMDALKDVVGELGGSLNIPDTIPIDAHWPLMVAKAVSHRAVHPLMLMALLEPWDSTTVQEAAELCQGIVVAPEHEPMGLLKAIVAWEAAETNNIQEPFVMDGQRHLVFMADLKVRDKREGLASAILFAEASKTSNRGKTTRAFSDLRRFVASISVEIEPDKHNLGLVIRFNRERYESP
ncbi:MAG: FHA domain-containing protein [Myxococcota bacterium]